MARFSFRLQPVLDLREKKEKSALTELAACQRKLQSELNVKSWLMSELLRALTEREKMANIGTPVSPFGVIEDFVQGTKHRIIRQEQAIYRAKKGLDKAMKAYYDARKQRKAIETLKENALAEFKKEAAKREQKIQDDLYIMRAARKSLEAVVVAVGLWCGMQNPLTTSFAVAEEGQPARAEKCYADPAVLADIKKKQATLDAREKEIQAKFNEIAGRERALKEQISKLEELKKEISTTEMTLDAKQEERVGRLVETVEKMSPKPAALLLAKVNEDLASQTMSRLSTLKLGKILAAMEGPKAARLSELITGMTKSKGERSEFPKFDASEKVDSIGVPPAPEVKSENKPESNLDPKKGETPNDHSKSG